MNQTSVVNFRLDGQRAVVTGASRGIGNAIAVALNNAGAEVVGISRGAQLSRSDQRPAGVREAITGDLSSRSEIVERILPAVDRLGPVDIFVHAAGINRRGPMATLDVSDWDAVMELNVTAAMLLARGLGPSMARRGHGRIILLASLLSFQGGVNVPAYAASKGAIAQLTKSMSNEWAASGVNVNAIAPGYVRTDMNAALLDDEARTEEISGRIPAGRWAEPSDIAGAAVFLASPAAAYVHGVVLPVDGGWLAR